MSYITIDETLNKWASKNNQVLLSEYKDYEVRSFEVFDMGKKFQIWIDHPKGEFIEIHIWDYKKRRKDWSVRVNELCQILDEAIATVFEWRK